MVTLKDVAERAGVSTATVSYVMNNKENKVSEGVAKKVRMAARELGYQPNIAARALRSSRSNIIGIISEDIATFQVNNIVQGINQTADRENYQILLGDLNLNSRIWRDGRQDYSLVMDYRDEIRDKVEIFRMVGACGIIYVGMHDRDITGLLQTDIPLVYAYSYTKNPGDYMVNNDNQRVTTRAPDLLGVTNPVPGHDTGNINRNLPNLPNDPRIQNAPDPTRVSGPDNRTERQDNGS